MVILIILLFMYDPDMLCKGNTRIQDLTKGEFDG